MKLLKNCRFEILGNYLKKVLSKCPSSYMADISFTFSWIWIPGKLPFESVCSLLPVVEEPLELATHNSSSDVHTRIASLPK
jgi:hypothetical protein